MLHNKLHVFVARFLEVWLNESSISASLLLLITVLVMLLKLWLESKEGLTVVDLLD